MCTLCEMGGGKYFPPQVDCLTRRRMWSGAETSTEGELITWTVINVKPASFSHHGDYVVGIVRCQTAST